MHVGIDNKLVVSAFTSNLLHPPSNMCRHIYSVHKLYMIHGAGQLVWLVNFFLFQLSLSAPQGTANREENYEQKATEFEKHSKKMAATAAALAKSGVVKDRKLADDLISTSGKVSTSPSGGSGAL